jgi:hypothetical protein
MKKKALLAGSVALLALGLAAPVGAQETSFTIEVSGVARGDTGTTQELINQPVEAGLVGATCSVVGRTENNESTHADNDLIITTGTTTAEVENVEELEFETINGSGTVTLGPSISISIRFGPDGVTSGGTFLDFTCAQQATTTVAPTTVAPTTAAPAPEGPPDTGAGGTAGSSDSTPLVGVAVIAVAVAGGALMLSRKRPATDD